jgi:hypothetical protein
MRHFTGTCRGGPFDGKDLAHTRREYRVAKLKPVKFLNPNEPPEPPEKLTPEWGTYRHVASNWVWRDGDADC